MNRPNPLGGTNRELQRQRLHAGPSQRAALAAARLPFAMGDGMRLPDAHAQSVSAQFVIEGSDPGAGVTTFDLAIGGGMVLGEGLPGIPVSVPAVLRWVATSWFSDNAPAGQWTIELWRNRGTIGPQQVATFLFNTTNP